MAEFTHLHRWRCRRCGAKGPPDGPPLGIFSAKVNDITESHREPLCTPCLAGVHLAIDKALAPRGAAAL